jgi:hypothetical protein
MKKTLFLFFFLAAIILIGLFFLNISDLKSEDICVVVVENGNDSIKNLPLIKSILNDIDNECGESKIIINSGSIFEQKENTAYYFSDVPGNLEEYSPAVKFLKSCAFDYTSLSSGVFEIYPERIEDELKRAGVKTAAFNSSFSGKLMPVNIGGVNIFFTNFISDKGFRYYNDKIKEKWDLTPPFQKPLNDTFSSGTFGRSDIKIAVFNDYEEIPFTADDFSEAMVFFNDFLPDIDIFITDGTSMEKIESLRESLITKSTAKKPAVMVFKFSVVKNETGETVAVIEKSRRTINPDNYKPDEKTEKMIAPYLEFYNDFTQEGFELKSEIKCDNPGRSECILDRLYAKALKESAQECYNDIDFAISYPVNTVLNRERGDFLTRGEISSIFRLRERSVAVQLSWEAIVEIMNNQILRPDAGFLAITPLRYIYSSEGNFLPYISYRNKRNFNVAMPVSLFKKIDDILEYEDKICLPGQFPFKFLVESLMAQKTSYFRPLWYYEEDDK